MNAPATACSRMQRNTPAMAGDNELRNAERPRHWRRNDEDGGTHPFLSNIKQTRSNS